jgi:hypothetical protein
MRLSKTNMEMGKATTVTRETKECGPLSNSVLRW